MATTSMFASEPRRSCTSGDDGQLGRRLSPSGHGIGGNHLLESRPAPRFQPCRVNSPNPRTNYCQDHRHSGKRPVALAADVHQRPPGQHNNAVDGQAYRGRQPAPASIFTLPSTAFNRRPGPRSTNGRNGICVNRRPDDVEPGHWGTTLPCYIPVKKKAKDPEEEAKEDEENTYWILKKFVVFNADQVSGAAAEQFHVVEQPAEIHPGLRACRATHPSHRGGNPASAVTGPTTGFPTPAGTFPDHTAGDWIQVPPKSCFVNGSFYPTVLHELSHWSEVRVAWDREKNGYPMGELIAEIASCYLATELGVPNT